MSAVAVRPACELARVRAEILARRQASEAARRAQESVPGSGKKVVWRCTDPHGRGQQPKVAEAYRLNPQRILVVTRIEWLPSDQLTLRPWAREHHLGVGLDDTTLQHALSDERFLSQWLDSLDSWSEGHQATGPRWLRGMRPTFIATLIEADREPVIRPWVRCKDHPGQAVALRRADIFSAFR